MNIRSNVWNYEMYRNVQVFCFFVFFYKKCKQTTLNHHPDLQQPPQLGSVHIDFAVWLEDRNKIHTF